MLVMLHGAGCAMGDGQFGGDGPGTFLIIGDSLNVINQMKGAFGAPGDARLHQLYRVARGLEADIRRALRSILFL